MKNILLLNLTFVAIVTLIAPTAHAARADYCPGVVSTNFDHTLTNRVSFDKKTGLYTYSYVINNSKTSLVPIVRLNMAVFEKPMAITNPPKSDWHGHFTEGTSEIRSEVQWSTIKSSAPENTIVSPEAQSGVPDDAVRPGKSLSGLIYTSKRPPGLTKYYIHGHADLPVGFGNENNEDPDLNCPNVDTENSYERTKINGMTVAPADPDVVQLKLRLRKKDSHDKFENFDIKKNEGQVSLLIMSSKDFDAGSLNVGSVMFGPDEAKVVSSKLVDNSFGGEKDDDREEWECRRDELLGKGNRSELKNLLLTFNIKDLGLQCVLDKALFLTGTTKTGKPVFGGVTAKIAGCEVNKPGRRKVLHPR
jgi:hypothetical protein